MDRSTLKQRRKQLGMTQQQIAEMIGVQKPTYQRYESGVIKRIDTMTIEKLSNALKTTPEFLMGWVSSVSIFDNDTTAPETEMTLVPILKQVAVGQNIFANSNICGYEFVSKDKLNFDFQYFFLVVKGDSMYPRILENDLALICMLPGVESGDYAIVAVDGKEGFISKVIYQDSMIELHSENPYYPVRSFKENIFKSVYIFGKVIEIRRVF